MLLPDGHGRGPLALGHGLLCPLLVSPPSSEMVGDSLSPYRCEGLPGQSISWWILSAIAGNF